MHFYFRIKVWYTYRGQTVNMSLSSEASGKLPLALRLEPAAILFSVPILQHQFWKKEKKMPKIGLK